MYTLKYRNDVPARVGPCMVGYPLHGTPDLCICSEFNSSNATPMNSLVLREALLANPELTKKMLGIEVRDIHRVVEEPSDDEEVIEVAAKPPKEIKTIKAAPTDKPPKQDKPVDFTKLVGGNK